MASENTNQIAKRFGEVALSRSPRLNRVGFRRRRDFLQKCVMAEIVKHSHVTSTAQCRGGDVLEGHNFSQRLRRPGNLHRK